MANRDTPPRKATARTRGRLPWSTSARRLTHWQRVRRLTLGLLAVWAVVTVGAPWFARDLNSWTIGGFPLGFWLCSEGAILVFVALIVVYAWVMDRWELAWRAAQAGHAGSLGDG